MVLLNKHPVGRHLRISVYNQLLVYTYFKQCVTDEVSTGAKYTISTIQLQYTAKTGSPCLILLYKSFLKSVVNMRIRLHNQVSEHN